MSNETVTIDDREIYAETDKAYGLWDGKSYHGPFKTEKTLIWVPKSKCEKVGKDTLEMPEWLALDKGLI